MEDCLAFDKNGTRIREFDVLKVFHFVGARRKKHYMYKWVRRHPGSAYLHALHMEDDSGDYYVLSGNYKETEIVQSPWQEAQELKVDGWK